MASISKTRRQSISDFSEKNNNALLNIALTGAGEQSKVKTKTIDDIKQISIEKLIPAPDEMNFFEPLNESQMLELRLSIAEVGVIQPLHVWAQPDGTYMILAGHNRTSIVKALYEETNSPKYARIPCIIYDYEELKDNDDFLNQIIVETNSLQRTSFSIKERVNLIKYKVEKYKKQKDDMGRSIQELGEQLGINKSTIYDDLSIGKNLNVNLLNYYYNGSINRKAALNISKLSKELQQHIYENYEDKIRNRYFAKMPKDIETIEDLENYLNEDSARTLEKKEFLIHVPEIYQDEFRNYIDKWLKEKGLK